MIISGLDNDIEFILHEGNFTIDECMDLIPASDKTTILKECNRQSTAAKLESKKIDRIQSIFYQPMQFVKHAHHANKGLIQSIDEFKKLIVVVIAETVNLYHPDTNFFYEMPFKPTITHSMEMEDIETLLADNMTFIFNKLEKPIIPCASLSIEGVEYF